MMKKIVVSSFMLMCACILKAQTITPKNTLKNWFVTGAKPTQAQFWAWMDSYYHKNDSLPANMISGLGNYVPSFFSQLGDVDVTSGLHDMQTIVWDSVAGRWINSYNNCAIDFSDITGNATDNSSLTTVLNTKQNTLPQQDVLDIYPYYYDGHLILSRFDSAVRKYAGVNAIDSSSAGFLTFTDSSNLMLNKGVIPNLDSFPSWGGFYRYSPSNTRGTRPTAGGLGIVMNVVAQDLKVSPVGAGRVYQLAMDGSLNLSFLRYYNSTWSAWDTIYTSSYHPGSGGGSASTLEDVMSNQGATAFTDDHTVDFAGHGLTLNNLSSYSIGNDDVSLGFSSGPLAYMGTNHSTIIVQQDTMIDISSQQEGSGHSIMSIYPSSINFYSGALETAGNINMRIFVDSSDADTNNIAWFDENNFLHRGHISIASGTSLDGHGYVNMSGTTPSYVTSIPVSDMLFNADIIPDASATYDLGASSSRFDNAYVDNIIGLNLNVGTNATSQNLKFKNGSNVGMTLLGSSYYLQLNTTPATNSETTPNVLIRNATSGNVEQISATSLPARVSTIFIGNQNTATITASTTTYGIVSGQAGTGILTAKSIVVGEAGTLKHAYLITGTAQDGSGSLVCTLYKNGSATSIVITVAAGSAAGVFSDNTHTVSLSAGDTLAWQFQNNATATSAVLGNTSLTLSN